LAAYRAGVYGQVKAVGDGGSVSRDIEAERIAAEAMFAADDALSKAIGREGPRLKLEDYRTLANAALRALAAAGYNVSVSKPN
jgi:hypothetical protein